MNDTVPKQQIAERIKNATNILVTVSRDPSVDELSAALALTLMLNKMDKHATAVFSGKVPPAITFLEPSKTFEHTVDSLRDFIIALDKNKADRLRYKVEDDVVRIFITPYKTTITEKDLQFSQGDFNVELIVALGVERREDLDTAITAHGRILHDAVTVTMSNKADKNSLGAEDWQEPEASSLSEMLLGLEEAMGVKILDEQIATALLTGIVSATQRFKNPKTTPRVMTIAAQLMGAGANQQLIASKLEEAQAIPKVDEPAKDGSTKLAEGQSKKLQGEQAAITATKADGEMSIEHTPKAEPQSSQNQNQQSKQPKQQPKKDKQPKPAQEPKKPAAVAPPVPAPVESTPKAAPAEEAAASRELDEAIASASAATPQPSLADELKQDLATASKELDAANEALPKIQSQKDWREQEISPPTMGGTLNATTEQAEEEKRKARDQDRNHMILTHSKPIGNDPITPQVPFNSFAAESDEPPSVDPFADQPMAPSPVKLPSAPEVPAEPAAPEAPAPVAAPEPESQPAPVQPAEPVAGVNDARKAVEDALNAMPFDPAHQPADSLNAQPVDLPPISHESTTPAPVAPPVPTPPVAAAEAPIAPPPLPPMPDFSSLPPMPATEPEPTTVPAAAIEMPPLPTVQSGPTPVITTAAVPSPAPAPQAGNPLPPMTPPAPAAPAPPPAPAPSTNDPAQYRIPGQ